MIGLSNVLDIRNGISAIQEVWVLNNIYCDENRRVEEINSVIQDINWRLRPDTALQIEKSQNKNNQTVNNKQIIDKVDDFFEQTIKNGK